MEITLKCFRSDGVDADGLRVFSGLAHFEAWVATRHEVVLPGM